MEDKKEEKVDLVAVESEDRRWVTLSTKVTIETGEAFKEMAVVQGITPSSILSQLVDQAVFFYSIGKNASYNLFGVGPAKKDENKSEKILQKKNERKREIRYGKYKKIITEHTSTSYLLKETEEKLSSLSLNEITTENMILDKKLEKMFDKEKEKRSEKIREYNARIKKSRCTFRSIEIFKNPFPNEFDVEYHHIHNWFTIPIPYITHRSCASSNQERHRELCALQIKKLYNFDFCTLLENL